MDQVEYRPTAGNADYRVGDDGSIWTGKRGGWRRMKPTLKDGYHQVSIRNGNTSRSSYVHRLIMEAFRGPCPDGMEVRHGDGNRTNNCLANLSYGTPKQNAEDRDKHGTTIRGSIQHSAKVTEADVTEMRRLHAEGMTCPGIALRWGLDRGTAHRIVTGRTWKHLPATSG
jgi:hypothetical protein